MANTKTTAKATETKTKTTATTNTPAVETQTDVGALKAQMEAQQKQIEALMELLSTQTQTTSTTSAKDEILADEDILVVSLTPNKLNLLGEGSTVLFSFDNMYEEQYIDYASLKEIVRVNRQMAKNGRFYILDERAVNKLRLKNDYKNILTPEQLKDLLNNNVDTVVELYKIAPDRQKDVIIELVKEKKFSGENIDYNLLKALGELCGVDLANLEDATQIEISK